MFDKEAVHDEKIRPLVEQIVKICREEKIPCVMDFMLKEEDDEHDPLHCIAALHGLEGMPDSPSIYMAIRCLRGEV
jgi:hypothetical protein